MEWAVIKGVADYADGTNSSTDEWKRFASFMAASVTANVLDPIAFKSIPNYKGIAPTTPEHHKQQGQGPPSTSDGKVDNVQLRKKRLEALESNPQDGKVDKDETKKRMRTEEVVEEVVLAKSI